MWLLTLAIVAPFATLLHELGHAIAARIRLEGPVRIRVGGEPALWQFAVAGVDVRIRPIFMPIGFTGACEFDAGAMRAARRGRRLAGRACGLAPGSGRLCRWLDGARHGRPRDPAAGDAPSGLLPDHLPRSVHAHRRRRRPSHGRLDGARRAAAVTAASGDSGSPATRSGPGFEGPRAGLRRVTRLCGLRPPTLRAHRSRHRSPRRLPRPGLRLPDARRQCLHVPRLRARVLTTVRRAA